MRLLEILFPQRVHPDYRRMLARAVYGEEIDVHIDPLCKDAANVIERHRQLVADLRAACTLGRKFRKDGQLERAGIEQMLKGLTDD